MAKIENTVAYPTVTPSADDLLIATDTSDDNKTVTFLVGAIAGGGPLQGLQSVLDTGNTATQNMTLTGVGPGGGITVVGTIYPTTITAGGSIGAAGQILSSTGTGIQWINSPATSCCSWNDTLTINNTAVQKATVDGATFQIINAGGQLEILSPAALVNTGTSAFSGQVNINSTTLNFNATALLNDGAGSVGTPGQFLTSTGTGVAWSSTLPPASCCGLQSTIATGNTSTSQNVTLSGTGVWTYEVNVSINSEGNNSWAGNNSYTNSGVTGSTSAISLTGTLWDGTSVGTAGQVLTSTGTGVLWAAASGGTQDLQSVLDTGNSASGANADITISGTLDAGTITDSTSSVGLAGQVLSSTGTGLTWINAACCDLQDTLTAGNTAITSIILSGAGTNVTAPLMIPTQIEDATGSTGAIGQVLGLNALGTAIEWVAGGGGGGVTSVTAVAPSTSTGTSLTINPTVGAVIVEPHAYGGTTNVGFVPTGGSATTFLRGDGTWVTPGATAGVSDLSVGAITASTGLPILISPVSPATGSVTINQARYTGDTNEGCVPRGSGNDATKYLDGTGSWTVPAGGGGGKSFENIHQRFYMTKTVPGADYWSFPSLADIVVGNKDINQLLYNNANAPDHAHWNPGELNGGMFYRLAEVNGCDVDVSGLTFCSLSFQITADVADTYGLAVYGFDPCSTATPVYLIGSCEMVIGGAPTPTEPETACCSADSILNPLLAPGHGLILTMRTLGGLGTPTVAGSVSLRAQHTSGTK
ncbi:MAG: hypothetical protein GY760_22315 [Deltaproteobacteria bacterium]|nr:hypothetical protein [Deltaproteobacteria bacterium]